MTNPKPILNEKVKALKEYKVEIIPHGNHKAPNSIMGSKWHKVWNSDKHVVYTMNYSFHVHKTWTFKSYQSVWVKEIGEQGKNGKGKMVEFRVNTSKMEILNNEENHAKALKEAKKQAWNYIKKMEA